jgi:chromosome segregation ATPase
MSHVLPSDTNKQDEILPPKKTLRQQLKEERQQHLLDINTAITTIAALESQLNEEMLKTHRLTEEIKRLNQIIGMWEKRYETQKP